MRTFIFLLSYLTFIVCKKFRTLILTVYVLVLKEFPCKLIFDRNRNMKIHESFEHRLAKLQIPTSNVSMNFNSSINYVKFKPRRHESQRGHPKILRYYWRHLWKISYIYCSKFNSAKETNFKHFTFLNCIRFEI